MNGQNPFVTQASTGTTGAQTASSSGTGSATAAASNPNATTPKAGQASTGPTVGLEIDTQGGGINTSFWSGALTSVGALSPNAPLAARVVVGNYNSGSGGVVLAYANDGKSALPTGRNGVTFANDNGTEALLSQLDQQNAQVLVEVQPGVVSVSGLAAEVFSHYKSHKSVVGVSINLSFYGSKTSNLGTTALADADATAVVQAVHAVSSSAKVYLRHYSSSYMPPTVRTGLGFTLDAQGFSGLTDMTQVFSAWASTFASSPVQFIIGGSQDVAWSCQLQGGAQALLVAATGAGSNVNSVMWSSDTITSLYPNNTFSCLPSSN